MGSDLFGGFMSRSLLSICGIVIVACLFASQVDDCYAQILPKRGNRPVTRPVAIPRIVPNPYPGVCPRILNSLREKAIAGYSAKIYAAIARIEDSLTKKADPAIGLCKYSPWSSVRNSCCLGIKERAVRDCQAEVKMQVAQDRQCGQFRGKAAQCCLALKQPALILLANYCRQAVERHVAGCGLVSTPVPSVGVPIATPVEPEAPVILPLEPITIGIPEGSDGKIPERVAE